MIIRDEACLVVVDVQEKLFPFVKNRDEIFVANGGCGGCITGLYPVDKNGKYYKNR